MRSRKTLCSYSKWRQRPIIAACLPALRLFQGLNTPIHFLFGPESAESNSYYPTHNNPSPQRTASCGPQPERSHGTGGQGGARISSALPRLQDAARAGQIQRDTDAERGLMGSPSPSAPAARRRFAAAAAWADHHARAVSACVRTVPSKCSCHTHRRSEVLRRLTLPSGQAAQPPRSLGSIIFLNQNYC